MKEESESLVDSSSIISKYIHRFRFEPPSSPSQRAGKSEKERKAFWWLDGKNVSVDSSYNEDLSHNALDHDDVSVSSEDSLNKTSEHHKHQRYDTDKKTYRPQQLINDELSLLPSPLPSEYYSDNSESVISLLSTFPERGNNSSSNVFNTINNKYSSEVADFTSSDDPFLKNLELCDQLLKSYEKENMSMESKKTKLHYNETVNEENEQDLRDHVNFKQYAPVPDVVSYRNSCKHEEDQGLPHRVDKMEERSANEETEGENTIENSTNSIDILLHHLKEIYGSKTFEDVEEEKVGTDKEVKPSVEYEETKVDGYFQLDDKVEEAVQTEKLPELSDSPLLRSSTCLFPLHSIDESCQTGLVEMQQDQVIEPSSYDVNSSLFLSSDEEDEGSIKVLKRRKRDISLDEVKVSQNSNEPFVRSPNNPSIEFLDVEAYLHDEIVAQLWTRLRLKREEIATLKKEHRLL
jgi:hypothetical protein